MDCKWIVLLSVAVCLPSLATDVVVENEASHPIIRVLDGEKELYRYEFNRRQNIYRVEQSVSGQYLLIWHSEKPPRRLKIVRIVDGKVLSDFVPGFGGRMMWTYGDKILHSWGCGTNCQEIRVYDITGGTLQTENVSGHDVSDEGFYVVFPTVIWQGGKVEAYDVNTGKRYVLMDELADYPTVQVEENRTVSISFSDQDPIKVKVPLR